MINKVELLDVTLRDGGLTNNFNFSTDNVNDIVSELDQSGIGHIEVGFRNGLLGASAPDMGLAGTCPKTYLNQCRKLIHSAKMTVMFHPKNLQQSDFQEMRDCGVDAVRMCFIPGQDLSLSFRSIEMAKSCGFEVFFNIMYMSKYRLEDLQALVFSIARHDVKGIYLADSSGHLSPEQIQKIYMCLMQDCKIDFGYHGHDNLFLAQANALIAINCGVKYIDASLSGLGQGVGNLRMEGIISLLRSQGCMNYNVPKILCLADYVNINIRHQTQPLPLKAIISGIFNLSKQDLSHLDECLEVEAYYALAEQYTAK